jgi:outer membrane protein insertion porin family
MMVWFLALLLLLAPRQNFAQTHTPPAGRKTPAKKAEITQWPIQTLSVEGNRNYKEAQILAVAGLKVGQLAGKPDFEAARDRLVATGLFETVGYRFAPSKDSSGYAASFQVTEVTPLYPVAFEGLPAASADLHAWLKSKDPLYGGKLPGTTEVLARYTKLLEAFFAARNQSQKVATRLAPTGVDQFSVVFRNNVLLATIAQVKFTGNRVLPATTLQNKISEVAYGFPYTEEGFRTLLDNDIRPLYDARGHARLTFSKITTEKASAVNGLVITVAMDEGPEYKLGEVRIAGNYAARSADLLKIGKFKTGEVANFDEIAQGVDRIKKVLSRQGYMRAELTLERALHDQPKTLDVTIRINEGPQFAMGKLTIEGLDLNGEAGIRKLWGLAEGKPFDGAYPDFFLNRVREDGIFDNLHDTKAVTKVDEQSHSVDVTLRFH